MIPSLILGLATALTVDAAVKTETVTYHDGPTILEGVVSYDDASTKPRPGVLVVHEWTGINPYVKRRLEMLAQLGYVAFAADIYGRGVRPTSPAEAGAVAKVYKDDRALMRRRVRLGLAELKRQRFVQVKKTAAIGYCFGGTTVLELARDGADVRGVVSFHGGLSTPNPKDAKRIRGEVLIEHGAIDPNVPAEEVAAFEDEMKRAHVKYGLTRHAGAVHSFTNPDAGADVSKGAAYNAEADAKSWDEMRSSLERWFK